MKQRRQNEIKNKILKQIYDLLVQIDEEYAIIAIPREKHRERQVKARAKKQAAQDTVKVSDLKEMLEKIEGEETNG